MSKSNVIAIKQGGGSTRSGGTLSNAPVNNLQATLNASYEIDFWGKNRAALRSEEELAVASRFDREVVGLDHRGRPSPMPISRCWPRRTG